jgi:hypothetical protein
MTRHLAVVLGLLCATSAAAQTLSLSAGGWNYRVAGEVTRAGQTQDLDDDLDVQGRRRSFLAAELRPGEYGPGWLPDLVLRRTRIDAAGQRTVSGSVSVGPVPIGEESGTAFVDADLEDRELTLRYPYRIRSLEAVAGISVKQLRGPVTVRNDQDSQASTEQLDELYPQLHAGLRWQALPRLRLGLEGGWISAEGNRADEVRVEVAAPLLAGLGLVAGWQQKRYDLQSGDSKYDARLSGLFVGLLLQIE